MRGKRKTRPLSRRVFFVEILAYKSRRAYKFNAPPPVKNSRKRTRILDNKNALTIVVSSEIENHIERRRQRGGREFHARFKIFDGEPADAYDR